MEFDKLLFGNAGRTASMGRLCAITTLLLSAGGIAAWVLQRPDLTRFGQGEWPAQPKSLLATLVFGGALLAVCWSRETRWRKWIVGVLMSILLALCVWSVGETLGWFGSGIEAFLFTVPPGYSEDLVFLVSLPRAALLALAGVAILALEFAAGSRLAASAGLIGGGIILFNFVLLVGMAYDASALYDTTFRPPSAMISVCWLGAGAGLIAAAGKTTAPLRWLAETSASARILRTFIFSTLLLLLLAEVLPELISTRTPSGVGLQKAAHVLLPVLMTSLAILVIARKVGGKFDEARNELLASRERLEERVAERTAELAARNSELESQIEQRVRAEAALHESIENYAVLGEAVPLMILVHVEGKCVYLNPAGLALLGYTSGELNGKDATCLVRPDQREMMAETARRLLAGEIQSDRQEFALAGKDNQEVWVESVARRIWHGGQRAILFCALDVSERKRLEAALSETTARERRRLGHELHDGLGQFLAGIAFRAKTIEQTLAVEAPERAAELGELVRRVNEANSQARALARGLAPLDTALGSLPSALERLALDSGILLGLTCRFVTNANNETWDPEAALHLYRITQEAIHNAARHGQARQVEIQLLSESDSLRLSIHNDGRGFDADVRPREGLGLRIMRHRAESIGGILRVASGNPDGVEVVCDMAAERARRKPVKTNGGDGRA